MARPPSTGPAVMHDARLRPATGLPGRAERRRPYDGVAGGLDRPPYDVARHSTRSASACWPARPPGRRCATCCAAAATGCAGSTRCAGRRGARPGRSASAASSTAPSKRCGPCSTRPSARSGRRCSPTPSDAARHGRDGARHAPERHRPGRARAGRLRLAQPGGQGDVRRDRGPAAARGARQPVPRHEAGARERGSPEDMQRGQGHAGRPQRDARGRCARRAHARSTSTSSWTSTATSSRTTRRPSRSSSTPSPGAPRRSSG